MSRTFHLIALALAAAAVAVPVAQAVGRPDDRAGPLGAAPKMSAAVPDVFERAVQRARLQPKVDPLAVGYLTGLGLSPSEVTAWTVGACSQESKPAVCYSVLDRVAAPVPVVGSDESGFDWADAGIGAGAALGFALLLAGLGTGLVISHRSRSRQAHSV